MFLINKQLAVETKWFYVLKNINGAYNNSSTSYKSDF